MVSFGDSHYLFKSFWIDNDSVLDVLTSYCVHVEIKQTPVLDFFFLLFNESEANVYF